MTDTTDTVTAHTFLKARERFADKKGKTNMNAARLLRAASDAYSVDLINDEEQEGVLFDVIEYLESGSIKYP